MRFNLINKEETKSLFKDRLDETVSTVLDILETRTLTEMRDAPDNSMYPLSRTEVERLLTQYERRSDDPHADENDKYDRSYEGAKRARWFPPEANSDYVLDPETKDAIHDNSTRPAKLMPYDYLYTVYRQSDSHITSPGDVHDTDDETPRKLDYSGENNLYEEDDSADESNFEDCSHHAASTGTDIEVELADGTLIFLDPMTMDHIKQSGKTDLMHSAMGNPEDFQDFLDYAYGKTESVEHDPIIKPTTADDYAPNPLLASTFGEALTEAAKAALATDPNFKSMGRTAMVNRVRGGKLQFRKIVSQAKGFRIQDGSLVRMTPDEMRRRKRGAKIAVRKKKGEKARIERSRAISLRVRNSRLGQAKAVNNV